MQLDVTHLITFLVGALSGAAGHYLGEKYTDERKKKENKKASDDLYKRIQSLMPALISEMRVDVRQEGHETVREFAILPSEITYFNSSDKMRFVYFENKHRDLIGKVQILEHDGLVKDVTHGNTPIYRMTEDFVDFLKHT